MTDEMTVVGEDGICRSFDEHYDTIKDAEQDPTGAMWAIHKQADRIEELEVENKLLKEQLAAIEEHGNEMLNALPDCLMRLAPALVENDELKSKLEKAVEALEKVQAFAQDLEPYADQGHTLVPALYYAATTLAELKGETDE